ncbi:hypothetical protein ACIQVL_03105 [Streptomyces sp. NPDC090499]|uniref:hypothetical protein n=1 Tax=Streptomyces sp. NPDC090499 TaxID=3365965 RepID=UPI0038034D0F
MTISDAISPHWDSTLRAAAAKRGATAQQELPAAETSIEFRLGPEHTPAESMRRARSFVAKVLPALLADASHATAVAEAVLSVLAELVDVTARYRGAVDLSGRVSCFGDHVLITVGEMRRPLPPAEEEPGLFLVRRLADEIGQHLGDKGGYAIWASVPVRADVN